MVGVAISKVCAVVLPCADCGDDSTDLAVLGLTSAEMQANVEPSDGVSVTSVELISLDGQGRGSSAILGTVSLTAKRAAERLDISSTVKVAQVSGGSDSLCTFKQGAACRRIGRGRPLEIVTTYVGLGRPVATTEGNAFDDGVGTLDGQTTVVMRTVVRRTGGVGYASSVA